MTDSKNRPVRWNKIREVRRKIANGYYEIVEVQEETVRLLLENLRKKAE